MSNPTPNGPLMVRTALVFYLPMMAGVFFLVPPGGMAAGDPLWLGQTLLAALAAGTGVIWASQWSARHTRWGGALKQEFGRVLDGVTSRQILWLSLLSAFGEEILFRGVLHGRLGLVWTALLFGLVHFPYRRTMVPWSLFALGMGFALGAATTWSNSLWPAILFHFQVNYFNLHNIVDQKERR